MAAGRLARGLRAPLPAPVVERARLVLAARLERRLRRSDAVRGAALVFHAVAPEGGDPETEIEPALAVGRLERIVAYLARRYRLVRAADLPAAARARRAGEPLPLALTFDDDLPSHAEHAAPVLARHGAVATAFLCGAGEPFWWQLLQVAVDRRAIAAGELPGVEPRAVAAALERRPGAIRELARLVEELDPEPRAALGAVLRERVPEPPAPLGREGAARLAAGGWELGYHTRSHHRLTALDERALAAELEPRPLAGTEPRTLAYPHGKAGPREAAAARRAGYVAAYTGRPEVVSDFSDDHLIGRLQPDTGTLGRFALALARALAEG